MNNETTDTAELIAKAKAAGKGRVTGPWKINGHMRTWIYAPDYGKGGFHVLDIRGWGHLTGSGHGALGLPDEEAAEIQDANARFVAFWGTHADTFIDLAESQAKRIAELEAENERLRAENIRYLPISEAPKDGQHILGCMTMRYKKYKPGAPTQKHGRWQETNGYGGWVNCKEQPIAFLSGSPDRQALAGEDQ